MIVDEAIFFEAAAAVTIFLVGATLVLVVLVVQVAVAVVELIRRLCVGRACVYNARFLSGGAEKVEEAGL